MYCRPFGKLGTSTLSNFFSMLLEPIFLLTLANAAPAEPPTRKSVCLESSTTPQYFSKMLQKCTVEPVHYFDSKLGKCVEYSSSGSTACPKAPMHTFDSMHGCQRTCSKPVKLPRTNDASLTCADNPCPDPSHTCVDHELQLDCFIAPCFQYQCYEKTVI